MKKDGFGLPPDSDAIRANFLVTMESEFTEAFRLDNMENGNEKRTRSSMKDHCDLQLS